MFKQSSLQIPGKWKWKQMEEGHFGLENPVIKVFEWMDLGSPDFEWKAKRPKAWEEPTEANEEVKKGDSGDKSMKSASADKDSQTKPKFSQSVFGSASKLKSRTLFKPWEE